MTEARFQSNCFIAYFITSKEKKHIVACPSLLYCLFIMTEARCSLIKLCGKPLEQMVKVVHLNQIYCFANRLKHAIGTSNVYLIEIDCFKILITQQEELPTADLIMSTS